MIRFHGTDSGSVIIVRTLTCHAVRYGRLHVLSISLCEVGNETHYTVFPVRCHLPEKPVDKSTTTASTHPEEASGTAPQQLIAFEVESNKERAMIPYT